MSDVPEGAPGPHEGGQPRNPMSARLPGQTDRPPHGPPSTSSDTPPHLSQPISNDAPSPHGPEQTGVGQPFPGQSAFTQRGPFETPSYSPTAGPNAPSGKGSGRIFATAGCSALLAAALASAGTYGVIQSTDGVGGNIETGNKTVINADPSDFADAGTVNWASTAGKVNPSVVAITVMSSGGDSGDQGSGVILDDKGNIVTNNHVVAAGGQGGKVEVTLSNNRTYSASVVGTDPSTDLAVIRIKNVKGLKPVVMGDDQKLVVGQPVMAVGNPLGLAGTVTTGIVSALDRPVKTAGQSSSSGSSSSSSSEDTVFTNAIQTSAAINPGNSGGALVDGSGKLIGINSSIASLSSSSSSGGQSGNIGIGFAIPTQVVKNITDQLISSGKAKHALLGISTRDDSVSDGGATLSAARVATVEKDGAAGKAGIKSGDEVISIDGDPVTSSDALVGAVRARKVGSKVKLTVLRDGQRKNIEVTLGAKESD